MLVMGKCPALGKLRPRYARLKACEDTLDRAVLPEPLKP